MAEVADEEQVARRGRGDGVGTEAIDVDPARAHGHGEIRMERAQARGVLARHRDDLVGLGDGAELEVELAQIAMEEDGRLPAAAVLGAPARRARRR